MGRPSFLPPFLAPLAHRYSRGALVAVCRILALAHLARVLEVQGDGVPIPAPPVEWHIVLFANALHQRVEGRVVAVADGGEEVVLHLIVEPAA